ncbi:hypothetical protein B0T19DRAFT_263988 [Cercophora scortea]|uniref:Uncharacterized protein n=1 Tax=Cercophora scortea TaxID=314031 RepID=A0AAE0IA77_9PEZI|nr:hypothetical protein B0T19DRAFT_263988 [Cercophora scortea]
MTRHRTRGQNREVLISRHHRAWRLPAQAVVLVSLEFFCSPAPPRCRSTMALHTSHPRNRDMLHQGTLPIHIPSNPSHSCTRQGRPVRHRLSSPVENLKRLPKALVNCAVGFPRPMSGSDIMRAFFRCEDVLKDCASLEPQKEWGWPSVPRPLVLCGARCVALIKCQVPWGHDGGTIGSGGLHLLAPFGNDHTYHLQAALVSHLCRGCQHTKLEVQLLLRNTRARKMLSLVIMMQLCATSNKDIMHFAVFPHP